MSQQENIINFVFENFDVLVKSYEFSNPVISKEIWMTRLCYIHKDKDIGLEIELDWREFDIFTLIVSLENGRIPSGYYISNGKPCRKHIANVYREQGWNSIISNPDKTLIRTELDFKNAVSKSKNLLMQHIVDLIEKGKSLF